MKGKLFLKLRNTRKEYCMLLRFSKIFRRIHILFFVGLFGTAGLAQSNYYAPNQTSNSYIKSSVFRQEIARFEINVARDGKAPLPITQVPRVQKGDTLKIKLLDEAVFHSW